MAITGASLQPIYDRLHGAVPYHPMSADTFADWSIEAGDIVTMSRDGETSASPVHSAHVVWRGSPIVTLNSEGKEKRDSIARISRRKYNRSGAGIVNTQAIYYDLYSDDGRLHSELAYSESILRVEFSNADSALRGEIEITASHLRTEYQEADGRLQSEFEITASHMRTEYLDNEERLKSEFELTASHLRTDFEDADARLYGALEVTASHLEAEFSDEVNSVRASVQVQANRIGLVVQGTGANAKIKAAQIVAAINDDGTSETIISADKVYISGTTKINDVFTVADGYVYTKVDMFAGPGKVFNGDHVGSFYYSQQEQGHSVRYGTLKKAAVEGNTLKIWKFGDADSSPSITFSKAASISGGWSGDRYTATATPGSAQVHTELYSVAETAVTDPPSAMGDKYVKATIRIAWDGDPDEGEASHTISKDVVINSTIAWTKGNNSGKVTGWSNAYAKVEIPNTNTSSASATFKTPNATASSNPAQNVHALSIVNNDNNSVNLLRATDGGTAITIARFSHNKYTAGVNSVTVTDVSVYGSPAATATSISVQGTASNGATKIGSVDITSQRTNAYNSGVTAGKNAVTITKGSWSGGQISFTKSEGTASTKSVQLVASSASWSSNTATVQIWDGTAADAQHGSNTGYTVTVDASARYNAGVTAGKNAVTITKGSWSSGKISFTKSEGTASTKSVQLTAASTTWNGNTASRVIWDGTAADAQHGVSTGYTVTVDASARYTEGYNAGYTAGQNSMGVSVSAWGSYPTPGAYYGFPYFTVYPSSSPQGSSVLYTFNQSDTYWRTESPNVGYKALNIYKSLGGNTPSYDKGFEVEIDATPRYDAGYSAGYGDGYSAGKSAEQALVRVRFGYYQNIYYANVYENDGSTNPSVPNTTFEFHNAIDDPTTRDASVNMYYGRDDSGRSQIADTPSVSLSGYWDTAYAAGQAAAATYPYTKTFTCTGATFSQSQWTYKFEYVNSTANMFTSGTTYKFHNNSRYT